VRVITASMSASYHMLSAPEAPAPTAMHRIAKQDHDGIDVPGAATCRRKRGEDDQRHHPRLQQREIVATPSPRRPRTLPSNPDAVSTKAIGEFCLFGRNRPEGGLEIGTALT
jgi:hypothetical protein